MTITSRPDPVTSRFLQAAEQAEAKRYPEPLHDLIVFTLELPLLECVEDDSERLRIYGRVADHMEKNVINCRDYVFKRIPLEMLLCKVGEEEVLMCPLVSKPLKPSVRISQVPLLLPCNVFTFNVSADIRCGLRLLHVTGPHIFSSTPGGRRSQAISSCSFCDGQCIMRL